MPTRRAVSPPDSGWSAATASTASTRWCESAHTVNSGSARFIANPFPSPRHGCCPVTNRRAGSRTTQPAAGLWTTPSLETGAAGRRGLRVDWHCRGPWGHDVVDQRQRAGPRAGDEQPRRGGQLASAAAAPASSPGASTWGWVSLPLQRRSRAASSSARSAQVGASPAGSATSSRSMSWPPCASTRSGQGRRSVTLVAGGSHAVT
jgi:hypothetical protein